MMWIQTLRQLTMLAHRDPSPQPAVGNISDSSDYNLNWVVTLNKPKLKFCVACNVVYGRARTRGIQYHLDNTRPLTMWFSCPDCVMLSVAFWTTGYSITCTNVCVTWYFVRYLHRSDSYGLYISLWFLSRKTL
jgi:hypothetical protein